MDSGMIGKVIDNFQILDVVGKGGMGVVYRAKDVSLDRDVALKMMDPALARDEDFLKRFKSEAKALAKLQNPNIVSIFALRETEIGFCLVMEFVEGNTLADRIRDGGALSVEKVLPIFKQILIALDHAHKIGVIHRDIKPSNIMLTKDDVVKVTDFGLAKIQQVSAATMTLGTGGTLFYMSPEQVRGLANVDARGDIYSLGMTLYEALVGQVPFTNTDTDFSIRQSIVEGKIPPPDKLNPSLPKGIVKVIQKSIEKDPSKRYQTAAEMWDDLEKAIQKKRSEFQKRTDDATQPVTQTSSGRPQRVIIAGSALVVLALAVWLLLPKFSSASTTMLSVTTTPAGAMVSINNQQSILSPVSAYKVDPGKVRIQASAPNYMSIDSTITLSKGEDMSVMLLLPAITKEGGKKGETPANQNVPKEQVTPPTSGRRAAIVLGVVPATAPVSVLVDGQAVANEGNTWNASVAAGKHQVEFRHSQYGTSSFSIDVKSGQSKALTCYYEGYVSVAAAPVWGIIVVNGKSTDTSTPKDRYPLPPGRHSISVMKNGYKMVG
ncbi:MAG: Protein kinase protein, partial [Bacteroidetes bacterium]|nr:Protein kinase protein [Bacteroidota bacterium]